MDISEDLRIEGSNIFEKLLLLDFSNLVCAVVHVVEFILKDKISLEYLRAA